MSVSIELPCLSDFTSLSVAFRVGSRTGMNQVWSMAERDPVGDRGEHLGESVFVARAAWVSAGSRAVFELPFWADVRRGRRAADRRRVSAAAVLHVECDDRKGMRMVERTARLAWDRGESAGFLVER